MLDFSWAYPCSTKSSTNIHNKNLLTIDFTNQNDRIDSPRSKLALLHLGIDESKLYYLTKSEYINLHPELRRESSEIKNRQYNYYEEKRKKRIEKAIQKREEIKCGSPTFASSRNEKTTASQFFDSSVIKRNFDQFDLMKKQNLMEIKNLIDFEINLSNKRNDNEEKLRMQIEKEEQMNRIKNKEKKEKEYLEKMQEQERIEQMKKEHEKKSKEYKEFFLKQFEEYKKEEKNRLKLQKLNLKKQLENQKKEEEFRNKVNENYQRQQSLLEIKQKEIEMKNDERRKKVEEAKNEIRKRLKLEQIKREKKCMNATIRKNEILQSKFEKYLKKQENILKAQKEQEMKKKEEISEIHQKMEEKQKKNNLIKNKNEQLEEERKEKLIHQFQLNEEKINNQKKINYKLFTNKLFMSYAKRSDMNEKIQENDYQLQYHNFLKLKEIEEKHKKVEELKRQKNEIAQQKIKLQEEMKIKKQKMIEKVNKILAQGKIVKKEEIYEQVFTKEDLDIVLGRQKVKSALSQHMDINRRKHSNKPNAQSFEGNNSLYSHFNMNEKKRSNSNTKQKKIISLSKSQSMNSNLFLTSYKKINPKCISYF